MQIRTVLAAALVAGVFAAPVAQADQAMAKKYNCMACHQLDKKSVGPSYKDVAKKYKGDGGAAAKLATKVKNGGSGTWGAIPMPPNAAVPAGDIQKMVGWILAM